MKGAEQLARSCRRLGREGVGARRAGTRTRADRAPRCPSQAEGPSSAPLRTAPRPAPRRHAAAALAPRGAGRRAPTAGGVWVCVHGCFASLPSGFLGLVFVVVVVGFGGAQTPFLGWAARGRPLSRVSLPPLFGDVPGDCCRSCY